MPTVAAYTVDVNFAARQGPPGPPGVGAGFTHTQSSPAATWIVNHNLGYRPVVAVYTAGGVELVSAVLHISSNQLQILLASAMAGYARCT